MHHISLFRRILRSNFFIPRFLLHDYTKKQKRKLIFIFFKNLPFQKHKIQIISFFDSFKLSLFKIKKKTEN